jgi:hypothetical protein
MVCVLGKNVDLFYSTRGQSSHKIERLIVYFLYDNPKNNDEKMSVELGKETYFDHHGSTYTCLQCEQTITVEANDPQTFPGHIAISNLWRLVCGKCLPKPPVVKQPVKFASFMADAFNEEYIQLTEYMIPFIQEEIRTHEEVRKIHEMRTQSSMRLDKILYARVSSVVDQHKKMSSTLPSNRMIPMEQFGAYSEYTNCMKNEMRYRRQYHTESIARSESKRDIGEIHIMNTLLREYNKRANVVKGQLTLLFQTYITPPVIKIREEASVRDETQDIPITEEELREAKGCYAKPTEEPRYTPPWVSDFVDMNRFDDKKTNVIPTRQIHTDTPGWVHDVDIPYRDN